MFLSSHILSDVERTCDEVVMINQGEVAFSRQIAAFQPGGDDWEIEVTGWTAAHRALLGDIAFSVATEAEGAAVLVCAAGEKKALLHRLTSLPMDVGTVQRRRGASLEDLSETRGEGVMARVGLVAGNVFRGILSKRALYVWAAAIVLMLLRSGPAIFFSDQNPAVRRLLRANAISSALDSWAMLALAAAIFLAPRQSAAR